MKPAKPELGQLQTAGWVAASIVEVLGIAAFLGTQADLGDPVIAGIAVISGLAASYFTRKWIASSVSEESLRGLDKR